jgi:hypothetical protein
MEKAATAEDLYSTVSAPAKTEKSAMTAEMMCRTGLQSITQ